MKKQEIGEELYACEDCGKPRTKDEGGTTFTVCEECWEKHYPKPTNQKIEDKMLEEIKPYLSQIAYDVRWYEPLHIHDTAVEILTIITKYCVIPEEGELPPKGWVKEKYQYIVTEAQEHMLEAGYGKYRKIQI